jgi:hypothetical protein
MPSQQNGLQAIRPVMPAKSTSPPETSHLAKLKMSLSQKLNTIQGLLTSPPEKECRYAVHFVKKIKQQYSSKFEQHKYGKVQLGDFHCNIARVSSQHCDFEYTSQNFGGHTSRMLEPSNHITNLTTDGCALNLSRKHQPKPNLHTEVRRNGSAQDVHRQVSDPGTGPYKRLQGMV